MRYIYRVRRTVQEGGVYLLLRRSAGWGLRRLGLRKAPPGGWRPGITPVTEKPDASLETDVPVIVPQFAQPVVSIIIPTYGQVQHTIACVASIVANPPDCPYEVIVLDDAYNGGDASRLQDEITGAALIRNISNQGFIRSCNLGASKARGKFLFFLNNDTKVLSGSIDYLYKFLKKHDDVGMVGSKLIFPDGSLQEAGGILWRDGNGWNYGRGDNPLKPEYCYVKDVDYISGAAIMLSANTFRRAGGFDLKYVPAYCEDSDLAFKVRSMGLRVMLEPRSVVVHFEGVSNGSDVSSGVKAHQVTNSITLKRAWSNELSREHYPSSDYLGYARDRRKGAPRILVIDHYVPEPDRDAGSRTMINVLRALTSAGWVVKFWPQNRAFSEIYTPPLQDMGIEVVDCRSPHSLETWLKEFGRTLDHVLISRPTVAEDVLEIVRANVVAKVSYYGHDLHFLRMKRQAQERQDRLLAHEAEAMKAWEETIWRSVDTVLYPSAEEVATVKSLVPQARTERLPPYCFEASCKRLSPTASKDVLFVAGFAHAPNVDAAEFLIKQVAPLVWAQDSGAKFILAGSNPSPKVKSLARDRVVVTGWVSDPDLSELYATSRVAVVPLSYGAGVKGKTLEALANGLPIVATTIGAEGIEGIGDAIWLSNDARGIANGILALLRDDALWIKQSELGAAYVDQHVSPQALSLALIAALTAA